MAPKRSMQRSMLRALTSSTVCALATVLLATPAAAAATEVTGFATGTVYRAFSSSGTALLDHFYYRYSDGDEHLRHISALPQSNGTIQIAFHDINADNKYFYRVAHQHTGSTSITHGSFTDTCIGTCTRTVTRPSPDHVFVLVGFRFYFTGDDHHIDEISVFENSGQVTTSFNDQNDDDTFVTNIRYAWVPRTRFSSMNEISGTVADTSGVRRNVTAGTAVIRGFSFNNNGTGGSGDDHIRELGIMTNSTSIDIYYGDDDPTDSSPWTYRVRYANLP